MSFLIITPKSQIGTQKLKGNRLGNVYSQTTTVQRKKNLHGWVVFGAVGIPVAVEMCAVSRAHHVSWWGATHCHQFCAAQFNIKQMKVSWSQHWLQGWPCRKSLADCREQGSPQLRHWGSHSKLHNSDVHFAMLKLIILSNLSSLRMSL